MSKSRRIVLAYIACWAELDAQQIQAEQLTHVNYAFACIQDGLVVNFMAANFDRLSAADPALAALGYQAACAKEDAGVGLVRRLKAAHPHLKALISIGGWAAEGFSDAALTAESRERFADSALEFIRRFGFDGVDLDWEYPCSSVAGIKARPEDRDNFSALLRILRKKLDAQSLADGRQGAPYLLSIATGAAPAHLEGLDIPAIAPELDFIGLMTYDLYNGWSTRAGHHANLYCSRLDPEGDSADKAVRMFLAAGVPASKLLIGAAFYGRGMSGVAGKNHGLMQASTPGSNLTRSYDELLSALGPPTPWTRYWDNEAQAPFLYDGTSFISYEDEQSVRSKARYVREHGLGGAMFWEYSNNRSGELLRALAAALHEAD
ncbi:MAG TPA: glycoside hydrolase family 18 protein [Polyangiaceae bacterium]|nr:glycoside hydrolase family 18 protein [Polyangiaceae bacterium]